MNNWKYTAISITKYQTSHGTNMIDEWTSFDDIGREFNGIEFTLEEYLQMEQKYIDAIFLILVSSGCCDLLIKSIEKYSNEELSDSLLHLYGALFEGCVISLSKLSDVMKLILRNNLWGEICCSINEDVCVRFGFDYYMYVNGLPKESTIWNKIREMGLVVR